MCNDCPLMKHFGNALIDQTSTVLPNTAFFNPLLYAAAVEKANKIATSTKIIKMECYVNNPIIKCLNVTAFNCFMSSTNC